MRIHYVLGLSLQFIDKNIKFSNVFINSFTFFGKTTLDETWSVTLAWSKQWI